MLVRAALAVLVGLYVAWWVVRIGVVDAEVDTRPDIAATVAPDHPRVRIALAMAYFDAQGGRVPDEFRRDAMDALAQAPLADQPFLLAGVDALAHGDNPKGERLLEEARRRNPRLRMARLLLLDRYLRDGRIPQAVAEIKALDNLVEGASVALTAALAQMTQDPATAPKMVPLLSRLPKLQEAVLESLVASGADESAVLNVAGSTVRSGGSELWKSALLARLVKQGALVPALDLWKSFTGYREGPDGKGIYDPDFAGLPGPAPFNWDLVSASIGTAERGRGRNLQVDYYGRDNGELARQLLVLHPGRYTFSFRASGDAAGEGSRLVWTIACAPEDGQLLQLPLAGVASASRDFMGTFTIPASGCPAQWLKLVGTAGEIGTTQSAAISGLSLAAEKGE
ncbi:MAG TPA: hypothetical protein VFW19_16425 [Allosphingosinicella sp.]|nr:hypothetical protein [Allosphingosinicella sp.]